MNEFEQTLVLIKPDALKISLTGYILTQFSEFHTGLRFAGAKIVHVSRMLAEEHYAEHRDKPFFGELVGFITSGTVVVARLQGESAIDVWRTMMGPTDPSTAPPGTIRGDFGLIITENIVHGSDSPTSAERELKLFFV